MELVASSSLYGSLVVASILLALAALYLALTLTLILTRPA
jgi:hypothetical protein